MDIAHQLSHELLRQDFVREQMAPDELDRYKMIACQPNKSGQDRRGLLHLGRRDPEIGAS